MPRIKLEKFTCENCQEGFDTSQKKWYHKRACGVPNPNDELGDLTVRYGELEARYRELERKYGELQIKHDGVCEIMDKFAKNQVGASGGNDEKVKVKVQSVKTKTALKTMDAWYVPAVQNAMVFVPSLKEYRCAVCNLRTSMAKIGSHKCAKAVGKYPGAEAIYNIVDAGSGCGGQDHKTEVGGVGENVIKWYRSDTRANVKWDDLERKQLLNLVEYFGNAT
jgi:hypothetical protein